MKILIYRAHKVKLFKIAGFNEKIYNSIMNEYIKYELENYLRSKKYLVTTYLFIVLAIIFYALFFLNTPEPVVILCALMFNIFAGVYIVKAIKFIRPLRQIYLAKIFVKTKTRDDLLRLCASLESAKDFIYGNYAKKSLQDAINTLKTCENFNLSDEIIAILYVKAQ